MCDRKGIRRLTMAMKDLFSLVELQTSCPTRNNSPANRPALEAEKVILLRGESFEQFVNIKWNN